MRVVLLLAALAASGCQTRLEAESAAGQSRWTVSGLSAGGYMATQLHVAYSSHIQGVAILAAGPYDCAQANIAQALGPCLKGPELDPSKFIELVQQRSATGEIDTPRNLADDPAWLFHGTADRVVDPSVTKGAYDFYARFIDEPLLALVDHIPAAHGMPTADAGASCDEMSSPFVNACDYDAAGAILSHLHQLNAAPANPVDDNLRSFNQDCCAEPNALMADTGYVYLPSACEDADCDIHMILHGCQQGAEFVQQQFVRQAGYQRWAEGNNLVLIFPQAAASPLNPLGCWDWWGYTGSNYATRTAPQVKALMAMFEHFSADPGLQ